LQDSAAIAATLALVPLAEDFNAMSFFNSVGKGKPIAGIVEAVLNGSTLRLTLLPDRMPVTVQTAGVQCPSMGKRPAPAPAAAAAPAEPAAESNGAAAAENGNGTAAPAAGVVTAASIAAAGGHQESVNGQH
jgi:staphylococcal nuclease domain-containing protein 1